MIQSTRQPARPEPPRSTWIRGGDGAPERARRLVIAQLDADRSEAGAADAALIVSELVTNSVRHASAGNHDGVVLELTTHDNHLRIAVVDQGSPQVPHILPFDPATPGGFGLRLVEQLSSAWGVVQDGGGTTRVWCDVPLGDAAAL